jgi:hypothetical protein
MGKRYSKKTRAEKIYPLKNKPRVKNYVKIIAAAAAIILLGSGLFYFFHGKRSVPGMSGLDAPPNVKIEVTGRLMTVSWDAVENAGGYQIYTTSTGCTSGNRIINTKARTVSNHAGASIRGSSVEFISPTSINILLMARRNSTGPMASAVSAKVKALSNNDKNNSTYYMDSAYSNEAKISRADYLPEK